MLKKSQSIYDDDAWDGISYVVDETKDAKMGSFLLFSKNGIFLR